MVEVPGESRNFPLILQFVYFCGHVCAVADKFMRSNHKTQKEQAEQLKREYIELTAAHDATQYKPFSTYYKKIIELCQNCDESVRHILGQLDQAVSPSHPLEVHQHPRKRVAYSTPPKVQPRPGNRLSRNPPIGSTLGTPSADYLLLQSQYLRSNNSRLAGELLLEHWTSQQEEATRAGLKRYADGILEDLDAPDEEKMRETVYNRSRQIYRDHDEWRSRVPHRETFFFTNDARLGMYKFRKDPWRSASGVADAVDAADSADSALTHTMRASASNVENYKQTKPRRMVLEANSTVEAAMPTPLRPSLANRLDFHFQSPVKSPASNTVLDTLNSSTPSASSDSDADNRASADPESSIDSNKDMSPVLMNAVKKATLELRYRVRKLCQFYESNRMLYSKADTEKLSAVDNNSLSEPSNSVSTGGSLYVRALYDYDENDRTILSFHQGDIIQVISQLESGWWDGVAHGVRGWFPSNYCAVVELPYENSIAIEIRKPNSETGRSEEPEEKSIEHEHTQGSANVAVDQFDDTGLDNQEHGALRSGHSTSTSGSSTTTRTCESSGSASKTPMLKRTLDQSSSANSKVVSGSEEGNDSDVSEAETDRMKKRRKQPLNRPKRFPCVVCAGEAKSESLHGDKLYEYISELECVIPSCTISPLADHGFRRPHRSHHFFACHHCLSKFDGRQDQEEHACIKSCRWSSCRRKRLASTVAPTKCECIVQPEQQWIGLYRLKYPDAPLPEHFDGIMVPCGPPFSSGNVQRESCQLEDFDQWFNQFIVNESTDDIPSESQLQAQTNSEEHQQFGVATHEESLATARTFDHSDLSVGADWEFLQHQQTPSQTTADLAEAMNMLRQGHAEVVAAEKTFKLSSEREEELVGMLELLLDALQRAGSKEYKALNGLIRPKIDEFRRYQ